MDNLSAQCLIQAFNTLFMAQGSPALVLSDAGSQLTAVSRRGLEPEPAQDEEEDLQISSEVLRDVSKNLATQNVEMRTHTPLASWRSGACESLIGCLKSILKETLVRQRDITICCVADKPDVQGNEHSQFMSYRASHGNFSSRYS